ncbi:MAG: hypothetical protein R3264_21760, partial [Anaerolineae bacterium]|nr:hypothetical protein [Anaerolineae bacterium]
MNIFTQPIYLLCFFPLAALALLLFLLRRQKQSAMAKLGSSELINRLSSTVNWRGRRWQTRLLFLALALLILALAR